MRGLLLIMLATAAHAAPPKKPALIAAVERSSCMGGCPEYRAELFDDGTLSYEGKQFTTVQGPREEKRTKEQVDAVIEHFKKAGFEKWTESTPVVATDVPKVRLTFRKKTLMHYRSPFTAPKTLIAFTDELDVLLGIKEWIAEPPETQR